MLGSETQKLKVILTEAEKSRHHETLLRCHGELAALEKEETDIKAQLKRRRTAIETRLHNSVSLLNSGYEFRDVEVDRVADYEAGLVRLVRQDTGEEIEIERLSDKERQTAFDLPPAPAPEVHDGEPVEDAPPPDGDGGWGAPSTGEAPTLGLGHEEIIEGEIVEEEPFPGNDDDDPEASTEEPAADGGSAPPADPDPLPWSDSGAKAPPAPTDDDAHGLLVEWYKKVGREKTREDLETKEPDEIRPIYLKLVPGAPVARSRKTTLIAAILVRLFGEEG